MSRCCSVPAVCLAGMVLAACSGSGRDLDGMPTGTLPLPLVAHGNAPFWWLRIDEGSVAFGTLGDQPMLELAAANVLQRGADGVLVCRAERDGRRVEATLTPTVRVDGVTGMPYPFAVTVRVDDRELHGVGGDPGELLRGFPWVVLQVGDRQLPAGLRPTIEFRRDGAMVVADEDGSTSGSWVVEAATLRLAGLGGLPASLRQEFGAVDGFALSAGGELVLVGGGRVRVRAARDSR